MKIIDRRVMSWRSLHERGSSLMTMTASFRVQKSEIYGKTLQLNNPNESYVNDYGIGNKISDFLTFLIKCLMFSEITFRFI